MKNSGAIAEKWSLLLQKVKKDTVPQAPAQEPAPQELTEQMPKWKRVLSVVWKVLFAMRKVVLALPVVICALRLAAYNRENLPELVGINLQSTGEFAQMIARDTAVNVPLVITFACLALMVFSRKTIYPWLISVFTLVLPVLLYVTNGYLG